MLKVPKRYVAIFYALDKEFLMSYQRPSNGRFCYSSAPAPSRGSEPLPVVKGEPEDSEETEEVENTTHDES